MKWEYSSMFTVSLVLMSIPISRNLDDIFNSQLVLNILFILGFILPGLIGGFFNQSEWHKAVIMIAISYFIIGAVTALSLTITCRTNALECIWIELTLLGIPIGTVLTTIGYYSAYKFKMWKLQENEEL